MSKDKNHTVMLGTGRSQAGNGNADGTATLHSRPDGAVRVNRDDLNSQRDSEPTIRVIVEPGRYKDSVVFSNHDNKKE